jgi:hypothetical protein
MSDDRKVHVLTKPGRTFGSTQYHTRGYLSAERNETFNVLLGYERKHDCDLAQIATAHIEHLSEVVTMPLEEAKHISGALNIPLIILLSPRGNEDVTDKSNKRTAAYFHDPAKYPSVFNKQLKKTIRKSPSSSSMTPGQ